MAHDISVARRTVAKNKSGELSWIRGMIRIECRESIALLTLNRPDKLNALDRPFWRDLQAALEWIREQAMRAIIFTGAGDRAFSVGGDIGSFAELSTLEERRTFQTEAMEAFQSVATCRIPTIAAVNGLALGGGCELSMACDFVLAGQSATLGMPEARFGLVPGYGVLVAPSIVGVQMAKLLIYTGETLSAEEALRCGLVQKLCDDEQLEAEAFRLARAISETSEKTIETGKALLDRHLHADVIARSIEAISELHATQESRAAVARFLDQHRTGVTDD